MSFLPENYEAPKSSGFYMKLQEGENRIRIMSQPILGWEDWDNNRPIRYRYANKPAASVDPKRPVKHFWAFIVYNYGEERIQILEVTQATIRKQLEALTKDSDWGLPYFYDLKITRTGEGKDTEYTIAPVPHKPINDLIIHKFKEQPCYLDALFDNADPFSKEWTEFTQLALDTVGSKVTPIKECLTEDQIFELEDLLSACNPKYKTNLMASLSKPPFNAADISKVEKSLFDRLKKAITENKEKYQAELNNSNLPF